MALTNHDTDDGSQVGPLLDQIGGPVAALTADGAYDRDDVHASVAKRHPGAVVTVPPRSNAVPSDTAKTTPTQRDRHIVAIARPHRLAEGVRLQLARPGRSRYRALEAGDRWRAPLPDRWTSGHRGRYRRRNRQ